MGDDAFFGAMRDWVDRRQFGVATGSRLLRHFLSQTDANLRPIFDAYLADPDIAPPRPRGRTQRPI